ncbi:MAG: Gfo/Idh/MocA family oxidoreductase [Thermoanaerobaculia bacterium]|nr:Gfo/Idh/MocA family oxidoreductase [Thermoanaerobaculia bacterium]
MDKVRIGVVGTGYLGRLHARVLTEMPGVEVVGFVEPRDAVAAEVESNLKLRRFATVDELEEHVECAVVATTTDKHYEVAKSLLEAGCDVMIEKPITSTVDDARMLIELAKSQGRIIQVGHVERYNPAIVAAAPFLGSPRYIEAERIGVFSGRSLDIDVLLDLMIHDLNLVLSFVDSPVRDVQAVGVPVLTRQVDMANVRIEFESGCVANLTASRVSTDRVRKFRVFGPDCYVSVDTKEQDAKGARLIHREEQSAIEPLAIVVEKKEPLRAELEAFAKVVRTREAPLVGAREGLAAIELALRVREKIDASLAKFAH